MLAFGNTSVAAWYCAGDPDPTIGQGSMFMDAITTDKAVHCVDGASVGATSLESPPRRQRKNLCARTMPKVSPLSNEMSDVSRSTWLRSMRSRANTMIAINVLSG